MVKVDVLPWSRSALAIGLSAIMLAASLAPAGAQDPTNNGIVLQRDGGRAGAPSLSDQPIAAGPASDVMDGSNLEALAEEIRNYGYQAKVVKLASGGTAIDSAASGLKFRIIFYSCGTATPRCTLDFGASWLTSKNQVALEKINQWNRDWRFAKAYNDEDGDLILKMYMTLTDGVTKKNFKANFDRWVSVLGEFNTFRTK